MKKLVVALSMALLGAGVGTIYLWRQMDALHARVADLQARLQAMETQRPATATVTAPLPAADTSPVSTGAAPLPAAAAVASNPMDRDMTRTMMRGGLPQMYPDLAQELGLAPDELDKFLDLLANQMMDRASDAADAGKKGKADQAAIETLLGGRVAQWQEYQQTLPARQQVNQLRAQLAASGSTLAEAQARPLMATLNAELQRIQQESLKNPQPLNANQQQQMDLEVQVMTESNHRLVEAAKPFLGAQQLDSYRQMLDRQIEMMRTTLQTVGAAKGQVDARN